MFLSFTSCFLTGNRLTDVNINKSFATKSKQVIIETQVEKYSPSKKWFYGTIKICNKTTDTLEFNFNQTLIIDKLAITPEYNLFPISYAMEAFEIKPKDCKTWIVAWSTKNEIVEFENITFKFDTNMIVRHYPICLNISTEKTISNMDWKDSIVMNYVNTTKNPLINIIKKDTIYNWSYIFDTDQRDGKDFITVRIGQSMEDHFATSSWLYIDSLRKQTFEMDIVNDSLIRIK